MKANKIVACLATCAIVSASMIPATNTVSSFISENTSISMTASASNVCVMMANIPMYSANSAYKAVMGGDGNLAVYSTKTGAAIWSSGTQGNPGAYGALQSDGNFVIYTKKGKAIWNTHTEYAGKGCSLKLTNDGVFAVCKNGNQIWSSRSSLTSNSIIVSHDDTLSLGECISSPNKQYRAVLQGDGNFVVYNYKNTAIWSTGTHYMSTPLNLKMQPDGNFVLYSNGVARWSTGTNGTYGKYRLELDNNGALKLINSKGSIIWRSK